VSIKKSFSIFQSKEASAFISCLLLSFVATAEMALNPDVTQETISKTICQTGYTKTVRPSTIYTNGVKLRLMREAGIDPAQSHDYALDHIIPLVLGGSPRSLENLHLLTTHDNARKSRIEVKLRCMVCSGQITSKMFGTIRRTRLISCFET